MPKLSTCPTCGEPSVSAPCASCETSAEAVVPAGNLRDETALGRDRAAERRDRGAEYRDERARQQEKRASAEDKVANQQDQAWSDGDQAASLRDGLSASEDQRVADLEFEAGGDTYAHRKGVEARLRSQLERESVTSSRYDTTTARSHEVSVHPSRENALLSGEQDRLMAAADRAEAAEDREEAARERSEAIVHDADAALAAERAIETLETMSDAFFTLDHEWRFTYVNAQTEMLVGRERKELLHQKIWDAFPELTGSVFDLQSRHAIREQVPVRFEERYTPLGATFQVRAHPLTTGLAVYFIDVTEERSRDKRLGQSERLETLGQLTAGIVHDFNNVLAIISSYASLGLEDADDDAILSYFRRMASAAEKGQGMTRQLLAFARQQDLCPMLLDLNEVVGGLSSLLHQLMAHGTSLKLDLSPNPVPVFVDRSQLEQVILNLVVNSRDAVEDGGTIAIKTSPNRPAEERNGLTGSAGLLQVTDTGCGIPEEVLPRIFDPFFSTKTSGEGTGLGLATIYGIVSQSGGSITVDTKVGQGTTMTVCLPAKPVPSYEITTSQAQ